MHVHTIGIVCLSSGSLGEPYMRHERMIGEKRLAEMGIRLRYLPHALAGREYIQNHPEKRAEDLLTAFRDPEIDMILCAIGGDDTYRLAPYLFADDAIQKAAAGSHKIFLGFSDTTLNHLMLHKIGYPTYYGQAFLPDVCELCVRAWTVRVSENHGRLMSFVFHWWWMDCLCLRLRGVLL